MFEDRKLPIFSYNVETIIAEKLQAMVSLKGLNSRMKDFYDLYLLFTKDKQHFSDKLVTDAIKATFKRREMKVEDILITINNLVNNDFMIKHWNKYKIKYSSIKNIEFTKVLEIISNKVKKLKL